jgi:hypothetical protein
MNRVFLLSIAFISGVFSSDSYAQDVSNQPEYSDDERDHWVYKPIDRNLRPPQIDGAAELIESPVDAFVLKQLRVSKLMPSALAERVVLIRRLSFDLWGLPPSTDDVQSFLNDAAPNAYEKLVDRMLADPRHGEQWAQHWLDVVRFAESEGFEYDRHLAGIWRYRDYVIRSLNADKPYDQFTLEQLAGDELVEHASDSTLGNPQSKELLVAAGFHRLGPVRRNAGNTDVAFSRNEVLTQMTDMIGTAFLGLTVGCARCHDHMFDAIRQQDYYQLQAFLGATHENNIVMATAQEQADWEKKTKVAQAEVTRIKAAVKTATGEREFELIKELYAAQDKLPTPLPTISSVKNDEKQRGNIHLLTRGDESKKGRHVGMRSLGILLPNRAAALKGDTKSPRTKLANWIVDDHNPLTARVIVNRIWQFHFGIGLVHTANDFGLNGSPPSHPQLLDFLASELIRNGWCLKPIHRIILLSRTYQQSSRAVRDHSGHRIDPDNRLLWRFRRRRLDAEEIRDAMLATAGNLRTELHGASVMVPVEQELINLLYKPTQWKVTTQSKQHYRRSIYLVAKRNLRLPFLEVFDQPDLQTSCSRREQSTHAPQALEMLNGRLSNELAGVFAERIRDAAGDSIDRQVQFAFQNAIGRNPTQKESSLAKEFLQAQPLSEFALAMFNLNAFLYVD